MFYKHNIISPIDIKKWGLGSSLDSIKIDIFLQIAGDPELCETIGLILKGILKQARLFMGYQGLSRIKIGSSGIMKSDDYKDQGEVFVIQFTITADSQETYFLTEQKLIDRFILNIQPGDRNNS